MEDKSRRTFLKVAGATVVGGVSAPVVGAIASGGHGPSEKQERQWAMIVDMKKCLREEGCDKCRTACHTAHNVPNIAERVKDEQERVRREVKWIWKQNYNGVFPEQQHAYTSQTYQKADGSWAEIPILCNHCQNPPCVRVCPTQATWKRESDGIVMMDMHRCIGCRYCVVGCPYGSRSFNWMAPWPRPFDKNGYPPNLNYPTRMKGVVEKCNFCAERLAEATRLGKDSYTPACVEACPAKALLFGDLMKPDSELVKVLKENHTIVRKPVLGTGPQIYYIV